MKQVRIRQLNGIDLVIYPKEDTLHDLTEIINRDEFSLIEGISFNEDEIAQLQYLIRDLNFLKNNGLLCLRNNRVFLSPQLYLVVQTYINPQLDDTIYERFFRDVIFNDEKEKAQKYLNSFPNLVEQKSLVKALIYSGGQELEHMQQHSYIETLKSALNFNIIEIED
jgi:hypothetical protein